MELTVGARTPAQSARSLASSVGLSPAAGGWSQRARTSAKQARYFARSRSGVRRHAARRWSTTYSSRCRREALEPRSSPRTPVTSRPSAPSDVSIWWSCLD